MSFERIQYYYEAGLWSKPMVKTAVRKGVITRDMKFELTESEALWRLRPDLTLAIGGFRTSGTVGREIRYVSLGKCTVLAVRKVPAPDAVEQQ